MTTGGQAGVLTPRMNVEPTKSMAEICHQEQLIENEAGFGMTCRDDMTADSI